MEWLGVLLLYLISGFMKKREQNKKRREIESDPSWDDGDTFITSTTIIAEDIIEGISGGLTRLKKWKNY